MFTVVVKESQNDAEVVFEAAQVRKCLNEGRKDDDDFIGEVRCDVPDGQIIYNIRRSAPANGSRDQTMYVMNRFGATVATYHL